jgi:GNAT superfamily N-acetyltransferase
LDSSYLDIDKQYSDLLKIGLDNPELREYEKTSRYYKLDNQDMFKKKYHIYANMCWNLVETIYDRQKDKKGIFRLSETWIPIMFEENRLHYCWFKHNIRLFKSDFQKFVSGELNDIEIIEGAHHDLKSVYDRFEQDFALDERKEYKHLEALMSKKKYKLLLAKHKVFNEIIGYAFIYETDKKILWLDYMAIDNKFQNAGYGTLLFNKIAELKKEGILGVFLEVEIPNHQDKACREDQIKRIKFYERLGAKQLDVKYQLPTNKGGFPMNLYFRPAPNAKLLPKELIKDTITSIFNDIHTDVNDTTSILESFIDSVHDENFN